MDIPTSTVVIFESNETRADLYALWLEEYDVRVALTKQQAEEQLETPVAVAILDQQFADGAASTLFDIIQTRAPFCRVIATRERSVAFPDIDVEHQVVKPVFEEDLVDTVWTLLCRTNYQVALQRYYRLTTELTSLEVSDTEDTDSDRHHTLEKEAYRLHKFLLELRDELSDEDIRAVMRSISVTEQPSIDSSEEKLDSKYRPEKCSHCRQPWDLSESGDVPFARLGAYVWRCKQCGHVQMHSDPSHRQVGSYRK